MCNNFITILLYSAALRLTPHTNNVIHLIRDELIKCKAYSTKYFNWVENNSGSPLPQIARFIGPTWAPSGSCRPQIGPMLAPWTLLSGTFRHDDVMTSMHFPRHRTCVRGIHRVWQKGPVMQSFGHFVISLDNLNKQLRGKRNEVP